jgi:hypothetical protein
VAAAFSLKSCIHVQKRFSVYLSTTMIKLCIDCKHLLQEDDMRWCTRPNAGYDLNPVDGSKQGGPENHPKHEMAFIERQADFRCGTEGRYFVAKVRAMYVTTET